MSFFLSGLETLSGKSTFTLCRWSYSYGLDYDSGA